MISMVFLAKYGKKRRFCFANKVWSAYQFKYFQNNPILKSLDCTNPPNLPTLKAYPNPGGGGRFEFFSLK